jgi:hypothetical protein
MKKCRTEFKGNCKVVEGHIYLYRCDITEAKRKTCSRYGLASDRNGTTVGSYVYLLGSVSVCYDRPEGGDVRPPLDVRGTV